MNVLSKVPMTALVIMVYDRHLPNGMSNIYYLPIL